MLDASHAEMAASSSVADVSAKGRRSSSLANRWYAIVMLSLVLGALFWVGRTAYLAFTDSFVAPSILSPDSDIVMTSKLRLGEILVERSRSMAELESLNSDIAESQASLARITAVQAKLRKSMRHALEENKARVSMLQSDLKLLEKQRDVLAKMKSQQEQVVAEVSKGVSSGSLSREGYLKEAQLLHEVSVDERQNERALLQASFNKERALEEQRSLLLRGSSLPTSEMMAREEQSVRFELDAMRLTSEIRAKKVQVDTLADRIAKNDEIAAQLRNKPIFRAAERRVNVAFVPYTQLEGVERGATVYDCVLGLFWCDEVGSVDEVLPGEVVVPDPWGSLSRGQYAVLNLSVPDAAKAKVLRIRGAQGLSDRILNHMVSSSAWSEGQ
jgi:hypothetical protein